MDCFVLYSSNHHDLLLLVCMQFSYQLSALIDSHSYDLSTHLFPFRNQRNKLKLDHLSAPSQGGQYEYLYARQNSTSSCGGKPLRHQRSSDNMVMGSLGQAMFVPNVQIDHSPLSGNAHPCQRKTSSAEDMMMRKNSAGIDIFSACSKQ